MNIQRQLLVSLFVIIIFFSISVSFTMQIDALSIKGIGQELKDILKEEAFMKSVEYVKSLNTPSLNLDPSLNIDF